MILSVMVIPNASRDEIVGWQGESLKIRIAAPPVEGKANEAVIKFLAKRLDLAPSDLSIAGGATGKRKKIKIPLTEEDVRKNLSSSTEIF